MSWIWSSVDCSEEHGTRRETYNTTGITCDVTLRVSAANKNALIDDLMSNSNAWPDPYLLYPPQVKSCAARPVTVHPTTPAVDQAYNFNEYLVDVSYSTDEAEDYIVESLEPETEFFRLDHTWFRWKSDSAPLSPGEAPGLITPKYKLVREFLNRTSVPSAILLGGSVHNAGYTSPTFGITFAAGTLMLAPQPVKPKRNVGSSTTFDYSCSFIYNATGWNKFLRVNNYTFDQVIDNTGTDYYSYPLANLLSLLV